MKKCNQLFGTLAVFCFALSLPTGASAQFTFSTPAIVDTTDNAFEPKIITDASGRIFIAAPPGLPGPSVIWRSTDGGVSFASVGPGLVGAVPTNTNITLGGGDCDLASDSAGNLYFVDLWVGESSSVVSHDNGNTWTGVPFSTVPLQDRPWVSANQPGVVFTAVEEIGTGVFISESPSPIAGQSYPVSLLEITDAARGFLFAPTSNVVTNLKGDTYNAYPLGSAPTGMITGPNGGGIGVGKLAAGSLMASNSTVTAAYYAFNQDQCFPIIAVDNANDNNLYVTWCDPVSTNEWDIRFVSSTDGGVTWSNAATVGHGALPWVTAGKPGSVDIAWYSAEPSSGYIGDPNVVADSVSWDVVFTQSVNALAASATFTSPRVAASGAKVGPICTTGSKCSGNRELGDFMSVTSDSGGNALISYVYVPRPASSVLMFTKQTSGTVIK